jgi:carbon monoxide dehydrogenase subunit G
MSTVTVEQQIHASPEAVWQIVTDVERWAEIISGIDKVEKREGEAFGVGFKWRETRTMMGKEATEDMWVDALVDGQSQVVSAASHGARCRSEISLPPQGGGTLLRYTFTGTPETFGAKVMCGLMGWMMKDATKKALAQDLVDIGKAAEA